MTTKLRLGALIIILFLPLVVRAAFDDVVLNSGTTLVVTVEGTAFNLTVINGKLEALAVDSGNLQVTLSSGSSVDLTSADRRAFTYTLANVTANFECGTSSSVLTLSLAANYSSETVVVTPTNSTCVTNTTSGGSGGGGGAAATSAPAPAPTPTPTPEPATTGGGGGGGGVAAISQVAPSPTPAAPAPAPAPTPAPASTPAPFVITTQLNPGDTNEQVRLLQALLAAYPDIYPQGTITGYYGPLTTAAVKRFQSKYGVAPVGRVGPQTLDKLKEVYGAAAPAPAPAPTPTPAPTTPSAVGVTATFTTGLGLGTVNDDVKRLQQLLNSDPDTQVASSGAGSPGSETTRFGPLTERAVQKFQVKYGVAGPGDPGYGYVGPKTRAKLQEVFKSQ